MIIVRTKYIPKWWDGKAYFPFILIRKDCKNEQVVFMHEKIHYEQQKEMLIVFAFIWYWLEYAIRFTVYMNYHRAYHQHSMEREAYENQNNLHYLVTRKRYSFLMYL